MAVRKLIAVTVKFAPVLKTEAKSPRSKISPRVERVTTYQSFLVEKGNLTPGQNIMPLILKIYLLG